MAIGSSAGASSTTVLRATATFPASLIPGVPLVRLHFNAPVSARRLPPTLTYPSLRAHWQQIGPRDVQAVTNSLIVPASTYSVSVPTQVACATSCVARVRSTRPIAAVGSTLWLQELLAVDGYLPVGFHSVGAKWNFTRPTLGAFAWRFTALAGLQQYWRVGAYSVLIKGALMRFQDAHGLATSGLADATTWKALITAAQQGQTNTAGYNYVDVSTSLPETLTLYSNGKAIFHAAVNTGISAAPTELGTYPVYVRYLTTTMSGTNPDGSHYSDPGIPWVSYFHGGDALHGFLRYSYGWPQSLGCVEMRYVDAHTVYPYTPIGTLVTVR
jgi:peptidoglycan hydrolase-like protein with peptidoglycan-binding domain